jgi:hypothetical protein
MNTDRLIDHLADGLSPVQPLRRPGFRAFVWLCGALTFLGVLTLSMMSRADVAPNGAELGFVGPQLVAVVTGILAAWAAFGSVIPGYTRTAFIWPVVAAMAWIGVLATGTSQGQFGATLAASHEWMCVIIIVLSSGPLMAVLWLMLRRGAPLNPGVTAALAALAVSALANVAACVAHPHTDNGVTLIWHGATMGVLVTLAAVTGHLAFKWDVRGLPAPATRAQQ